MESNFVPVPGAKVTKDYDAEAKDSRPEAQVKPVPVVTKHYIYGHQFTTEVTTYYYAGKSTLVEAMEKAQLDDDVDWNNSPPWKKSEKINSPSDNDVVVFDQVTSSGSNQASRRRTKDSRRSSTESDSDSADEVHSGRVRISCPHHGRRINFRERLHRLRSSGRMEQAPLRYLRMQTVQDYSVFFE